MFSNPFEMIQFIKGCKNPKDIAINMLEQQAQINPNAAQILSLVKQGNSKGVEDSVRQMVSSQGKNFDEEFNAFKKTFGL